MAHNTKVGPCLHCETKGKIWTWHSGDGHGGRNGGEWDWLRCSDCQGKGHVTEDDLWHIKNPYGDCY